MEPARQQINKNVTTNCKKYDLTFVPFTHLLEHLIQNKHLVVYTVFNYYKNQFVPKLNTDGMEMPHPTMPTTFLFLIIIQVSFIYLFFLLLQSTYSFNNTFYLTNKTVCKNINIRFRTTFDHVSSGRISSVQRCDYMWSYWS